VGQKKKLNFVDQCN